MSGRVLTVKNYLKGSDNVQCIEMFPRTQRTFTYDFDINVSGYEFTADYHTLVIDQVTYDRVTNEPSFSDSAIVGYFGASSTQIANSYINNASASTGEVSFTIPQNRYTGQIMPDARANVVATVVSFQWKTDDTTPQYDLHRWLILERWEAGVTPGDPTLSNAFIKIGSGAVSTYSHNGSTDASRTEGTYLNIEGIANGASEGSAALFDVVVNASGTPTVNIVNRGVSYAPGDTITIYDTKLGGGGAANIIVTVTATA